MKKEDPVKHGWKAEKLRVSLATTVVVLLSMASSARAQETRVVIPADVVTALRNAKTIRVLVSESYRSSRPTRDSRGRSTTESEWVSVDSKPESIVAKAFEHAPARVVVCNSGAEPCDLRISINGRVTYAEYALKGNPSQTIATLTAGMSARGNIWLKGSREYEIEFFGGWDLPREVNLMDAGRPLGAGARTALETTASKNSLLARLFDIVAQVYGPTAIQPFLSDPNFRYRIHALRQLGSLRAHGAVSAITSVLLGDASDDVRAEAAASLGAIGNPAGFDALSRALKDPNSDVREQALVALAGVDAARALAIVLAWLDDAKTAASASKALVRIGDRAIAPLVARVAVKEEWAVTEALRELGRPAAEALVPLLTASDTAVRNRASDVVVRIGAPAVPVLVAALSRQSADERRATATVLSRIGRPSAESRTGQVGNPAVRAIVELLKGGPEDVRIEAARALGYQRHPEARDALIAGLATRSGELRLAVIEAIGRYFDGLSHNQPVGYSLIPLLKDPDPRTRIASARAIARVFRGWPLIDGKTCALKALVEALDDKDPAVTAAALAALNYDRDDSPQPAAYWKDFWKKWREGRKKSRQPADPVCQ